MAVAKSYRLLCPIARALDKVGDRWSLLIVRDLHAGPARFGELQGSLPGLASNLLSSRLEALQRDGLVAHRDGAYLLTPDGEATAPLLFELAAFGSRFAPPAELREPSSLRTVAVTMKEALRRVVDPGAEFAIELLVDDDVFAISVSEGAVQVQLGELPTAPLSVEAPYEALVAVGDGRMSPTEFAKEHLVVGRGTRKAAREFLSLLGAAFAR